MTRWSGRRAQRLVALTLATYGTTCHLCLKPGATSADHVTPRSAPWYGDDSIENLRPAHKLCNERRGNRSITWFRSRFAPHLVKPVTLVSEAGFFSPESRGNPRAASPLPPGGNKFRTAERAEIDPETMAFFTPETARP